MNILIAEDDKDIAELLKLYLESEGYNIFLCHDGESALKTFCNNEIHLCIFDIMMPLLNGYDLVKKIREISLVPIIILSAKGKDSDKIIGLNIGADDYITKPFNPMELIARVNSAIRRTYDFKIEEIKTIIEVGEIKINTETFSLYKNNEQINITPTEFKILSILIKDAGKIYTKEQLYKSINEEYIESDNNTMMVHISHLRDKIEDDPKNPKYIKTIRGIGYKFEKK